ncbi:hypothetical protein GQ607_000669 [Colletotrichum asianum]|uniref:Pyroglutamyl-peptidase 1 n=1 Tax=Colletotrichum asianum TaxID=702518 RepID=A0A8H3WQZ9_9PEZI|nr:hypothetical protein GQ607_000669 [Colletotrichum asianum]
MAPALAPDHFVGFDVSDDDKSFLLDALAHPGTPWEEKVVVSDICLFSGFEDWYLKLECAASIRDNRPPAASELDARDVLAFVPRPTKTALANEELRKGWAATDQSIKNLSAMLRVHRSGLTASPQPVEKEERVIKREGVLKRERDDDATEAPRRVKRQRTAPKATSHYFAPPGDEQAQQQSASTSPAGSEQPDPSAILRHGIATPRNSPRKSNNPEPANASASAGTLAIPTFYKIKDKYPTPAALAEADPTTIMNMTHHLGLSVVRTAAIQRYARLWLEKPPTAGVLHRVKNYDKRDILLNAIVQNTEDEHEEEHTTPAATDDSWEMGHFTQGKYALDSWRIFCRDELLGRAQDWNGKGAAPNFQPEWMRVRPDDKELRACLRWMWMREGWEWDPVTGEKTVLREEMRKAVNERRVEYDEAGGLKIVDEPRSETGTMGSQIDSHDEFTVLVTGFGPFKVQYPVNPSWEIAHSLPAYLPPLRAKNPKDHPSETTTTTTSRPLPPVRILVHPEAIRVNYQTVRHLVPQLWDPATHPRIDAVVHIGMAGPRLFYSVERRGHRDGYAFPDVDGNRLEDEERRKEQGEGWVWYGCPDEIETEFDLGDVLGRWKAHSPDRSDLRISEDAGHYLCDFIYFSSLAHLWKQQKHRRVVFLHVPSDASEEAVATGTELTIQLIRSIAESELEKRRNKGAQSAGEVVGESDKIAVELRV